MKKNIGALIQLVLMSAIYLVYGFFVLSVIVTGLSFAFLGAMAGVGLLVQLFQYVSHLF